MPAFEKTTGGEVYLRGVDQRVREGERVDADGEFAAYLRDRGDFHEVDAHDADFQEVDDEADGETCDEVLDSGDVCGRELPCRYHSEDDEDEAEDGED